MDGTVIRISSQDALHQYDEFGNPITTWYEEYNGWVIDPPYEDVVIDWGWNDDGTTEFPRGETIWYYKALKEEFRSDSETVAKVKEKVLEFIRCFRKPDTINTFTRGCCYWFAHILDTRFAMDPDRPQHRIMYNDVDGHFACEINGELYDITGEVKRNIYWVPWADWFIKEPVYRKTVVRDCIMKTED